MSKSNDAHAPKWPKCGMKMAESLLFMNQFPPKHHRMFSLIEKNHSVKLKRKKKKLKKLGQIFFDMMPTLQKRPKFGIKMAES